MPNPWLDIPLEHYEGHMSAPGVAQLDALAGIFERVLALRRPQSAAVLGVAGGNGLDRIDPAVTKRIVAIDINSSYLDAVADRYAALPGLEFYCADLAAAPLPLPAVDLVHAALIFEHAGMGRCLENAAEMAVRDLSVVLQLPSDSAPDVAVGKYSSIRTLENQFALIDPESLRNALEARGFELVLQETYPVESGKAFWNGIFVRGTEK